MLNMTLAPRIPGPYLTIGRVVLAGLFFGASRILTGRQQPYSSRLAFILMVVNLAFLVVSFVTPDRLSLNLASPEGIAYAKLVDSVIISFVLICMLLLNGFRLDDLYLVRGKLAVGLLIGLAAFSILVFLTFINPQHEMRPGFVQTNMIWILIFIFSNAFMEELLFRGIFQKTLNNFLKPGMTVLLTSIVFASAHLQVTYTPNVLFFTGIVFVLALMWGFLMHFTQSIIASFLFHAGSDLMIIIPIYVSFGVGNI